MNTLLLFTQQIQQDEIVTQFANAIRNEGLEPPTTIIQDGNIHRYRQPEDKPHTKNGWYVLYADFPPAGAFGCWKRQIHKTFSLPVQREDYVGRIQHTDRLDSINRMVRRESEKQAAVDLWEKSTTATAGCKYLVTKGIKSHGLRYNRNTLLVPVMDFEHNIHGLLRIWPDGSKGFAPGAEKRGHFFLLGEIKPDKPVLIAEGYATAATLYETTGLATVVAFDSGNLPFVAKALRSAIPNNRIIVCADDDHVTPNNPGLTKASEAAAAIGGQLAIPLFPKGRQESETDFNDLYLSEGAEAVIHSLQIAEVLK